MTTGAGVAVGANVAVGSCVAVGAVVAVGCVVAVCVGGMVEVAAGVAVLRSDVGSAVLSVLAAVAPHALSSKPSRARRMQDV
jgi:hypothetical protein